MALTSCPIIKKPILEKSTTFVINANNFQPGDLDLFVESIEILARFEKKHCTDCKRKVQKSSKRRQRKALKSIHAMKTDHLIITTAAEVYDFSPKSHLIPQIVTERRQSISDNLDEPITHLEVKKLRRSESDETYYSGQDSSDTSSRNSIPCGYAKLKISSSDSEESGVFPVGEPQHLDDEPIIRPRSEVVCKTKNVSPRSKFIDAAVKRQCALSKSPSITDDEISEEIRLAVERCDLALAEVMNQKYDISEKGKRGKRRRGFALETGSQEEHFLDRALSLLSL